MPPRTRVRHSLKAPPRLPPCLRRPRLSNPRYRSAGVAGARQRGEVSFAEPVMPLTLHDLEEDLAGPAFDEGLEEQARHAVGADFAIDQHRAAAQRVEIDAVPRQSRIDFVVIARRRLDEVASAMCCTPSPG